VQIAPHMTVVDLGCGDGYFTAATVRQVGDGGVIGFDLSPKMLTEVKVACDGTKNCSWVRGDAMDLSRGLDAPADCVLVANTFHEAPRTAGAEDGEREGRRR
jgi:ubiquinone/menaquinone biosynthesis C-methylase UbiE